MAIQFEQVKGGFRVDVPPDREEEFREQFPKAKNKGGAWIVPTREEDRLTQWAGEDPPAPAERDDVETDDLRAIELELDHVGPDLVRKRILERQRDNIVASRARRA